MSGGAELSGPGTSSAPAMAAAVATLKTACAVVPEWACTIATSAWPRSLVLTSCVSAVSPLIGAHARPVPEQRVHW